MQDLRTSEKLQSEISDGNPASLEYIPFKKRRILVKPKRIINEPSNTDTKSRCKILDFTSIKESQEDEGLDVKEYKEKEEEESGGRRGIGPSRICLETNDPKNKDFHLQKIQEQEENIISNVSQSITFPLVSFKEKSQGIVYECPMNSIYTIPSKYKNVSEDLLNKVRSVLFIDVIGTDIPPPILKFEDMRLPKQILKALRDKGIETPTKIQIQALPAAMLGRDVIGISSTGSGKTLVFVLPMLMQSWELELRLPIEPLEGPFGLVLCPSRELASQICEITDYFISYIRKNKGPSLRCLCVIGGTTLHVQQQSLKSGVHMVVATPGRLSDFLNKKIMNLAQCRFLCFDEADRLIDLGFEHEIGTVFDNLKNQRQTLLFSATMPKKIQEFARQCLTKPIIVNVGLSGSANKNVKQDIISVSKHMKLPCVLKCLKKTEPPVLIFCENKPDVDIVHEYLLLKGVDVSSIHGGLSQEERNESIKNFKKLRKDVLIGTDVASKGLDFPSVKHVINFDLPRDIENYIHRIGRTGRGDKKGLATTLLDGTEDESSLRNLKSILIESNQEIPGFLKDVQISLDTLKEIGGLRGCAFCGALGHRIAKCPKLESERNKMIMGHREDETD